MSEYISFAVFRNDKRNSLLDQTHLNDDLHQVFLRNHILAIYDLLQNSWEYNPSIHIEIHAFKLR